MPSKPPSPARKLVVAADPSAAFKLAEALAKATRLKAKSDAKPYQFAVNYRLDKTASSAKGDYATRYKALTDLLKVLGPKPWHYATSSWEVRSHQTSKAVLAALSKPLDDKIDVLVVTPIATSAVFGDPNKLSAPK